MPYQLNGQLVTIKSQRLPHPAGALAAAGGGAFVTMISPGDTSAACAAPASPRITAARTAILFIDSGAGARHEPGQQRGGVMTRVLCPFMVVPPRSCPLSGHSPPQRPGRSNGRTILFRWNPGPLARPMKSMPCGSSSSVCFTAKSWGGSKLGACIRLTADADERGPEAASNCSCRLLCNDRDQPVTPSSEPRHHGADRHLRHLVDFAVVEALQIAQHQRLAERRRQCRDCRLE